MEEENTRGGLDLHQTIQKLQEPATPRIQFYNEDGKAGNFYMTYC
jgi:hypothetical protein